MCRFEEIPMLPCRIYGLRDLTYCSSGVAVFSLRNMTCSVKQQHIPHCYHHTIPNLKFTENKNVKGI